MARLAFLIAIISALFAQDTSAQDKPVATPVEGKIEWVFDLAEGQKISKATGKPIFIVFRCER